MSKFEKNCSQKTTFWILLLHKSENFCVFPIFEKHHLESKILQCVILGLKKIRRAIFVFKSLTMRQNSNYIFYNVPEDRMKRSRRSRNWKNAFKKSPFIFLQRKNDVFSIFCASSESMTLNYEFYHAYKFQLKR